MNTTTTRRFRRSALLGTAVLVLGMSLIPSALASDTTHQALVADQAPAAMADFHNVEDLERDLLRLAVRHPKIAKLHVIGRSVENRPIWALQLGERRDNTAKKKVLILGGHHAAEWISVEVPYLLAEHLATHATTDPDVQQRLQNGEIWIVPLVNPDGHKYVEPYVEATRLPLWRKNRRPNPDGSVGVDLNRNYGFMWNACRGDQSTFPWHPKYVGPHAFSEPETRAVRKLMDEQQFAGLLTYHSAAQLILFPWGYTKTDSTDHRVMEGLAIRMQKNIYDVHREEYKIQQSSEFKPTAGDATDWAYGRYHIPAFTIELRPKIGDVNSMSPDHIKPSWEENLPAAQEFIRHVFDEPPLRGSEPGTCTSDKESGLSESTHDDP